MKDLLRSSLLLYLLMPSISHSVTVHPSNSSDPDSEDVLWPESTNKVAITVQCPNHKLKFSVGQPDQGNVILRGANESISLFCKDAGSKRFYDGERWFYSVDSSGPCKGAVGSTDTLIIEWTQEGVKLMRDEEIIISRTWGPTDGHCLKKTASWRIRNSGSTVISGKSVLGTRFMQSSIVLSKEKNRPYRRRTS